MLIMLHFWMLIVHNNLFIVYKSVYIIINKISKINIWNRTPNRAQKLADELKSQNNTSTITVFDTAENCVKNADVIVTATYATEPILKYDWLKPGCHINGNYSYTHFGIN